MQKKKKALNLRKHGEKTVNSLSFFAFQMHLVEFIAHTQLYAINPFVWIPRVNKPVKNSINTDTTLLAKFSNRLVKMHILMCHTATAAVNQQGTKLICKEHIIQINCTLI